jgi:hypothetical protein
MKLRVKPTATKGHRVNDQLIPPGGTLPGDWPAVPVTLTHVLEEAPASVTVPAPEPAPTPPPTPMPPPPPPKPELFEPEPEPELPEPEPDEEPEAPVRRPRGRPPGSGRFAKGR